ncbi:MAG: metallophosphoesterase [Bacillota bacterium]|nr:metallophosphoesterase [Bacillota bacterium]
MPEDEVASYAGGKVKHSKSRVLIKLWYFLNQCRSILMKIEKLNPDAIENIYYKTIVSGDKVTDAKLPILLGKVSGLPKHIDALVVTSDLQGIVRKDNHEILLGEVLADYLPLFIEIELSLIPKNIGVVLCGDLYATLGKRGGLGDVRGVWNHFNKGFKWVAGISGNHDSFGEIKGFEEFKKIDGIHYFDKEISQIDCLSIAGISGIIGDSDRVNRISKEDYLQRIKKLLLKSPDILILHQTPGNLEEDYSGDENIRRIIEASTPTLVFCGHIHWEKPLIELANKTQVLNVDSRVVILLNHS